MINYSTKYIFTLLICYLISLSTAYADDKQQAKQREQIIFWQDREEYFRKIKQITDRPLWIWNKQAINTDIAYVRLSNQNKEVGGYIELQMPIGYSSQLYIYDKDGYVDLNAYMTPQGLALPRIATYSNNVKQLYPWQDNVRIYLYYDSRGDLPDFSTRTGTIEELTEYKYYNDLNNHPSNNNITEIIDAKSQFPQFSRIYKYQAVNTTRPTIGIYFFQTEDNQAGEIYSGYAPEGRPSGDNDYYIAIYCGDYKLQVRANRKYLKTADEIAQAACNKVKEFPYQFITKQEVQSYDY
jgi:hypothetical protein